MNKLIAIVAAIAALLCFSNSRSFAQSTQPDHFKFRFYSEPADGAINVSATQVYDDKIGYGFEPGAKVSTGQRDVFSDEPFCFSVKVPEGNYRIKLTLGDGSQKSITTVKTELRRLALERIATDAGKFAEFTITANVRQPEIPGGGMVSLKAREKQKTPGGEWFEWDDKLELEFSDTLPAVSAIEIEKVDALPTVYLCGDSTMCDQPAEPFNSWGQMFPRWFKSDIVIANEAESGETLKDFYAARRVDKIMSTLKAGDFVMVAFGHNDMKPGTNEPPEAYKDFYARLVSQAKSKGAAPIIMTPVSRQSFGNDGKITNSFKSYPQQVRDLAKEQNIAFIDLQNLSATLYESIGQDRIKPVFATSNEKTHHSDYGSYQISKIIVQALIDGKSPLASHVVDDWKTFDPTHPIALEDFKLPRDANVRNVATPLGN